MIAFDVDVDVDNRKREPRFYGYIPDDNWLRGRCFVLMTIISALRNVSRSLGVALLAASSNKMLVFYFVGGEFALFFLYKIARGDIWFWLRLEGITKYIATSFGRLTTKIVADFSGCLHLRNLFEMGGIAFSASMVWTQIMPFVALQFFEGSNKYALSYYNTFFGTMTGPQYVCEVFSKSKDDATKFTFAFIVRLQNTKSIEAEVKE